MQQVDAGPRWQHGEGSVVTATVAVTETQRVAAQPATACHLPPLAAVKKKNGRERDGETETGRETTRGWKENNEEKKSEQRIASDKIPIERKRERDE